MNEKTKTEETAGGPLNDLEKMGVPDDKAALGNAETSEESVRARLQFNGPRPNPNACNNH